jgi:membrane peptidoglycan carboxypeptidase
MLQWHALNLSWWLCTSLHLSEQEQLTVYLSLAPMGNGIEGFSNASTTIVGVPLGEVTPEQAATLLAVSKSPANLEQPNRLARQAAALLQRARGEPSQETQSK